MNDSTFRMTEQAKKACKFLGVKTDYWDQLDYNERIRLLEHYQCLKNTIDQLKHEVSMYRGQVRTMERDLSRLDTQFTMKPIVTIDSVYSAPINNICDFPWFSTVRYDRNQGPLLIFENRNDESLYIQVNKAEGVKLDKQSELEIIRYLFLKARDEIESKYGMSL